MVPDRPEQDAAAHPRGLRAWPPALVSLLSILAACLVLVPLWSLGWRAEILVLSQGAIALLLSRWLGLPAWWQVINAAFVPLAWLVAQADVHPGWFLAGFLLLAVTSLGSLRTRVPLYLSSREAALRVAELAPPGATVIDLGCGLGGWLNTLHQTRPDLRLAGVEMAPLNWLISRLRLSRKADIRLGSLWESDLTQQDIVYAYLSPAPMARLWEKATGEMRPGSLLISNSFAIPGQTPDRVIELDDFNQARLLIWQR
jgi:hypothetical protein